MNTVTTVSAATRVALLAYMTHTAGERKLGRTQVMKLFYFLQELKGVDLGYDFRLFNYGPFDADVLADLSSACNKGAVSEETVLYPRGYGYEIKPGPCADDLVRELEASHADLAKVADEVVAEFANFGAGELELRSTILFVERELNANGSPPDKDELAKRVGEIKPHFGKPLILNRIDEMRAKGWLPMGLVG